MKRFEPRIGDYPHGHFEDAEAEMCEVTDGEYIRYSDHLTALASPSTRRTENEALEARIIAAKADVDYMIQLWGKGRVPSLYQMREWSAVLEAAHDALVPAPESDMTDCGHSKYDPCHNCEPISCDGNHAQIIPCADPNCWQGEDATRPEELQRK